MADGLFDNRYRYDYIYPRGRSGETLRAVDTQKEDRRVVIKRPNPNDAPPIRAGQEVSIINEREALARLAGHPVLTELLGSGQFFVGGIPHQYIVMERAEGDIIADEITLLNGQQRRLPVLEMVEIIDRLVDLLRAAHEKDIVYNDVDAKHLFWDRDQYTLKVIDWGNAVFLEGDEVTSQGISRQSDIYQLGELLYFILSGGRRIEVPRDAHDDFQVDFHGDSQDIDPRLQAIVTRAVHPNLRYRYASLSEFSADMQRFRGPLERSRKTIIKRVTAKLASPDLSRNDLLALQSNLNAALRHNPAYPTARATAQDIADRLRDIEVAADLDAVRIYLESDNWTSAAELLSPLRDRAGSKTAGLVHLLLDWCLLLDASPADSAPPAVATATAQLFDLRADKAANTLLLASSGDEASERLCQRLAERVSAHFAHVMLLQPNLARVESAIQSLEVGSAALAGARKTLDAVKNALRSAAQLSKPGAGVLRDAYRDVADSLSELASSLQALGAEQDLTERRLPLNALQRARNAALALVDNMQVIGTQAANNPRAALSALDASRAIDPINPVWDKLEEALSLLYEVLQGCQAYVPAADGADLEQWLAERHGDLQLFAGLLFDDMLASILDSLEGAASAWARYRSVVVAGNRSEAHNALADARRSIAALSPSLSNWFDKLQAVIEKAQYIERHALPGHLGRTLADGWAAFDRGQLADAQRLGQQALEISRNENEEFIAQRLWRLSRALRDWVERDGARSEEQSQQALFDIEELFTEAENREINGFAAQMPSTDTYLKAMAQGLVSSLNKSNTAALRILFAQYIFNGALDMHDGALADARFWQTAALRTLPNAAESHIAVHKLEEFIQQRSSLLEAQDRLNTISGPQALERLGELARELESSPQARQLAAAIQSLRAFESAVADWADAEFRAASNKIDQALRSISEVEADAKLDLAAYRAWLSGLHEALEELSAQRRRLLNAIDRKSESTDPLIREAIHNQADITEELLGYKTAQMMLGWRDSYEAFDKAYSGDLRRSEKLERMSALFKDMFIDRHPAYPLFRHWQRQIEALPEDPPAPEAAEESASETDSAPPEDHAWQSEDAAPEAEEKPVAEAPAARRDWRFTLVALVAIALILGGLLSLAANGSLQALLTALAPASTATASATAEPPAPTATSVSDVDEQAATAIATGTQEPAATATSMPTEQPTAAASPEPAVPPIASPPPEGLSGAQDLLELYQNTADWQAAAFDKTGATWRLGDSDAESGATIRLQPQATLLDSSFGNEASRRIRRHQAELALHSANASGGDAAVSFGILLRSASGEREAGLQIQQEAPDAISLALVVDGEARVISQRSVSNFIARLRLERDAESGTISAYFNDSPVGEPISFLPVAEALSPAIFVRQGVIVSVAAWDITLE